MAISEGSAVSIGTVIVMAGITAFIRNKAKADNADTMTKVSTRIVEDLKPIIKRMDDHEQDFKEFKKQEIEPLKADMNALKCKTSVMDTKIDSILVGIDDIKKLFEKSDKQIENVWKVMQTKQDKK